MWFIQTAILKPSLLFSTMLQIFLFAVDITTSVHYSILGDLIYSLICLRPFLFTFLSETFLAERSLVNLSLVKHITYRSTYNTFFLLKGNPCLSSLLVHLVYHLQYDSRPPSKNAYVHSSQFV